MSSKAFGDGFFSSEVEEVLRSPLPLELAVVALPLRRAGLRPSAIQNILAFLREDVFAVVFEGDAQDPQRVNEYAADVFSRLLETESRFLPKPHYMGEQKDINNKMRAILINWLVEVHMKWRLTPETLFLTVSIVDRYLSVRQITKKKLQCLGATALFIAAKYEEIRPPKLPEFVYICDGAASSKEITSMECSVLVALDFQIAVPTPVHFLDRLQRANCCDVMHRSLAQYAVELSLLDLRYSGHPPSLLVSAALLMSNEFLGRRRPVLWPAAMVHYSRYCESSLRECAACLRATLETAGSSSLQAVRQKYQSSLNHAVADLSPCRPREAGESSKGAENDVQGGQDNNC